MGQPAVHCIEGAYVADYQCDHPSYLACDIYDTDQYLSLYD